jgi:WD40-like Beta Propeller Repeat
MSDHALEAVIADARRLTRRRRRRNAALALLTASAVALAVSRFAGGPQAVRVAFPAPPGPPMHNGPIAILGGTGDPMSGWYGVSRIGVFGRLQPFLRCPHHANWCGEAESIAWSRSGARLAISVTSFGRANPYNGIHVIDMRTKRDTQIRSCNDPPGECDWFDLAWSPDGRTIAFVSSGNIVLVDADGRNRRVLRTPPGRKSSPAWSPEGRAIAFSDEVAGSRSVYRVDTDGANLRRLAQHATGPAWSRTGTIAYHTDCGIQLMKGDGTPIVPRSANRCGAIGLPHLATPVWSPDGRKIAATLSRRRPDPTRGTYVMNADGTNVVRVTTATLDVFVGERPRVAWQPRR